MDDRGPSDPPRGMRVEVDDDGPPLPPPLRRRRRRRIVAGLLAAIVVVGVPVGLAVAGAWSGSPGDGDGREAGAGDESPGDAPDVAPEDAPAPAPDGDAPGDELPQPPDPTTLDGTDAAHARLLLDVDGAERVMMGFQGDLADHLGAATPGGDVDALLAELAGLAEERHTELLRVRTRLEEPLDDSGAEEVRTRYVAHLDAWADYLSTVAEEPGVVLAEDERTSHTLAINTTADAFSRALEARLDGLHGDVRRFAEAILERGFRTRSQAAV